MLLRLSNAHDPDLAVAAILALSRRGSEPAWDRIAAALNDPRLEVRVAAAGSLARIGGDRAATALAERLSALKLPRDDYELDEILRALRQLADPSAEAAVSRVLESDHMHERSQPTSATHGDLAAATLEAIGSPSARAAIDAWRERT